MRSKAAGVTATMNSTSAAMTPMLFEKFRILSLLSLMLIFLAFTTDPFLATGWRLPIGIGVLIGICNSEECEECDNVAIGKRVAEGG